MTPPHRAFLPHANIRMWRPEQMVWCNMPRFLEPPRACLPHEFDNEDKADGVFMHGSRIQCKNALYAGDWSIIWPSRLSAMLIDNPSKIGKHLPPLIQHLRPLHVPTLLCTGLKSFMSTNLRDTHRCRACAFGCLDHPPHHCRAIAFVQLHTETQQYVLAPLGK